MAIIMVRVRGPGCNDGRPAVVTVAAGRHIHVVRLIVAALGTAILLGALFLDRLGLGQPGGFGIGQFLLAVFGAFLVLVGLLAAKIVEFHRATALVLLNTLLLLGLIELTAIVVSRMGVVPVPSRVLLSQHMRQPYYASQDWSETYWREAIAAEDYRYRPYVGWRHTPFTGQTINVDGRGLRMTPGSECTEQSFTLFTFGGSSMWGWGSPDWGTIPAHLHHGLRKRLNRPVCVVNFGEDAWVSTQGRIALAGELQRGIVPDLVIFYDGVNEVFAAFETGIPAAHLELTRIAARFEERQHPLLQWLSGLRTVSLGRALVARSDYPRPDRVGRAPAEIPPADSLAAAVVNTYLENFQIAVALAESFGFHSFFFWQPSLAIEGKRLTDDEAMMRSRLDSSLIRLSQAVYARVEQAAPQHYGLWYIADVFDEVTGQVWIDELGHVTPAGNALVAQRMLALIDSVDALH